MLLYLKYFQTFYYPNLQDYVKCIFVFYPCIGYIFFTLFLSPFGGARPYKIGYLLLLLPSNILSILQEIAFSLCSLNLPHHSLTRNRFVVTLNGSFFEVSSWSGYFSINSAIPASRRHLLSYCCGWMWNFKTQIHVSHGSLVLWWAFFPGFKWTSINFF